MDQIISSLQQFWQFTGIANFTWQHGVMILIGIFFITMGIVMLPETDQLARAMEEMGDFLQRHKR